MLALFFFTYDQQTHAINRLAFARQLIIYEAVNETQTVGNQAIQSIMDSENEMKMKIGERIAVLQVNISSVKQSDLGHFFRA